MTQTALKVYEKVQIRGITIDQRRFFNYLNEAINVFLVKYGPEYVLEDAEQGYRPIESLNDPLNLKAAWMNALFHFIIGEATDDMNKKAEAMNEAEEAYSSEWGEKNKGKHIKRNEW